MALRLTVLALAAAAVSANVHDRSFYEEKFFNWLKTHQVKPVNGMHFVQMLKNFADNEDFINTHNAKGKSYQLGHNKFSHLSQSEYASFVKLSPMATKESTAKFVHEAVGDAPAAWDWTTKGGVTGVKDQGQCGSCWSFSTTGAMEGAYFNKNGNLVSFSEQEFVDCDNRNGSPKGSDMGCNGGLMDNAFTWATKNGGICSEADYPYTSGVSKKAGTCNTSCTAVPNSAPKSHTDVAKSSDSAMMSALYKNPVSIAIQADQKEFQLYKSGVFTGSCGTQLDHGVLAVGYGSLNGEDFYKVKNSWGTVWGDAGYILLGRGDKYNNGAGQCGMLTGPPSYPNY